MSDSSLPPPSSIHGRQWWLLPHLLALDAPIIAVLWQKLVAAVLGVHLLKAEFQVLFLAVWTVYLMDRWLDTASALPPNQPIRRRFTASRRKLILVLILLAGVSGAMLSVNYLPGTVWLLGGALATLACYRLLRHTREPSRTVWLRAMMISLAGGLIFFGWLGFADEFPNKIPIAALIAFGSLASVTRQWRPPFISKTLLTSLIFVTGILIAPGFQACFSTGFDGLLAIGGMLLGPFFLNLHFIEELEPDSHDKPFWAGLTPEGLMWGAFIVHACGVLGYAWQHQLRSIWLVTGATLGADLLLMGLYLTRHRLKPSLVIHLADFCLLTPLLFLPVATRFLDHK